MDKRFRTPLNVFATTFIFHSTGNIGGLGQEIPVIMTPGSSFKPHTHTISYPCPYCYWVPQVKCGHL